jgi:hypothetical protein
MPLTEKMTLYPIHAVGQPFVDDEPFDDTLLPAQVSPGVTLEKVAGLLTPASFHLWERGLSRDQIESFANIDYAIVHRFHSQPGTAETEQKSDELVRSLAALLRIIRPMRQRFFVIQGTVESDGRFVPNAFEEPQDYVEIPEAHKIFHLRPRDLVKFQQLAPTYLRAMGGEYWSIRLAVQFHDIGHFTFQRYWKLSWFSWMAGLESLYTVDDHEHRGQLVVKERIKHLLGSNAPVYEPGDIPSFLEQPEQTVVGVVGPIYQLRNTVVHGQRVPDIFYIKDGRVGLDGPLRRVEELLEALSFLLRKSIMVVLERNLLETFKDDRSIKAYFSDLGLTRAKLSRRLEIVKILAQKASPMDLSQILQELNQQRSSSCPVTPFSADQVKTWLGDAVAVGQIVLGPDSRFRLPASP